MIKLQSETKVLVLGDSISSGYGVNEDLSWPSVLQKNLHEQGYRVHFTNASEAGVKSAFGKRRLKLSLRLNPDILILALGTNDVFEKIAPDIVEKNLEACITLALDADVRVILAALKIDRLSDDFFYIQKFHQMYENLSSKYGLTLIPSLLEGIRGDSAYFQKDFLHPNALGHFRIHENVKPVLIQVLGSLFF